MEVNGTKNLTTATPVPDKDSYDLQSILTHEVGHFLGLAHTLKPDATMNRTYRPGTMGFRNPSPDDVLAICAAYPPGRPVTRACYPEPRHGFSSECATDPPPGGCSTALLSSSRGAGRACWLTVAFGAAASRARRRARRSPR
jgi:hypothetical protein